MLDTAATTCVSHSHPPPHTETRGTHRIPQGFLGLSPLVRLICAEYCDFPERQQPRSVMFSPFPTSGDPGIILHSIHLSESLIALSPPRTTDVAAVRNCLALLADALRVLPPFKRWHTTKILWTPMTCEVSVERPDFRSAPDPDTRLRVPVRVRHTKSSSRRASSWTNYHAIQQFGSCKTLAHVKVSKQ